MQVVFHILCPWEDPRFPQGLRKRQRRVRKAKKERKKEGVATLNTVLWFEAGYQC